MKILYIEDYERFRKLMSGVFMDAGHEVVAVSNIPDAINELSKSTFDRIVCDGTLDPENRGDGIRFAQELIREGKKAAVLTFETRGMPADVPCAAKSDTPEKILEKLLK